MLEELLYIHEAQLIAFGGAQGVRDPRLLQSALARPPGGFGGQAAYPTPFARAAALMESLLQNQGFIDGNKRTGTLAMILWLEREGYDLDTSNEELVEVALGVAERRYSSVRLSLWIKQKCRPLNTGSPGAAATPRNPDIDEAGTSAIAEDPGDRHRPIGGRA